MNHLNQFRLNLVTEEVLNSSLFKYLEGQATKRLHEVSPPQDGHSVSSEWVRCMTKVRDELVVNPLIHNFATTYTSDPAELDFIGNLPKSIHVRCMIQGSLYRDVLYPIEDVANTSPVVLTHDLITTLNPTDTVQTNLYLLVLIHVYLNNLNCIN